ncbi:MAG: hypothetical protein MUF14_06545 [Hyphomonadaceae bacterium]|jgi:cell wall-associated NlpC family hydrolase|nr:hypothetical protein [Hyphomonadaceae bacterium]
MSVTAAQIEQEARSWLGTPFVAGASVRGAGCDCGGLPAGVLANLGIPVSRVDELVKALALNHALLVPDTPQAGAILALSTEPGGRPVHLAIQTSAQTLIHAHWTRGVVENRFGRWFRDRLVAAYVLKGASPWQP